MQHKDTLAIGLFQKSQLSGKAKEMDELLEGRITELLKEGDISSKRNQLSKFFPSPETGIKRIYFVGLGKESDYTFEEAKEGFAHLFRKLHQDKKQSGFGLTGYVYWKGFACPRSPCPF
ncbi:M17 family peptidase N-terminal domain-containing protein [Bacillus sp. SL00103]